MTATTRVLALAFVAMPLFWFELDEAPPAEPTRVPAPTGLRSA